jgi:hypothetical protein
MSQALPVWVQYAQALGAPVLAFVIAGVGAWVGWQQMRLAQVKLQHDLYDRRFAVFQSARQLLADVVTHGHATDEQIRAYVIGTSDAVFLLDTEVAAYLEKIRSTVLRLNTINKIINPLPVCKQRSELADEDANYIVVD